MPVVKNTGVQEKHLWTVYVTKLQWYHFSTCSLATVVWGQSNNFLWTACSFSTLSTPAVYNTESGIIQTTVWYCNHFSSLWMLRARTDGNTEGKIAGMESAGLAVSQISHAQTETSDCQLGSYAFAQVKLLNFTILYNFTAICRHPC